MLWELDKIVLSVTEILRELVVIIRLKELFSGEFIKKGILRSLSYYRYRGVIRKSIKSTFTYFEKIIIQSTNVC